MRSPTSTAAKQALRDVARVEVLKQHLSRSAEAGFGQDRSKKHSTV